MAVGHWAIGIGQCALAVGRLRVGHLEREHERDAISGELEHGVKHLRLLDGIGLESGLRSGLGLGLGLGLG